MINNNPVPYVWATTPNEDVLFHTVMEFMDLLEVED